MLKVSDYRTWADTDGSCHIQKGRQKIGAGVYRPQTDSKHFVEPNGAGITNAVRQAEDTHMQTNYRLGYVNPRTGYYSYHKIVTIRACYHTKIRKSVMLLETCSLYPHL
eukprot:scaffold92831_cov18-Tisochrysis_lutea.AAC.1